MISYFPCGFAQSLSVENNFFCGGYNINRKKKALLGSFRGIKQREALVSVAETEKMYLLFFLSLYLGFAL